MGDQPDDFALEFVGQSLPPKAIEDIREGRNAFSRPAAHYATTPTRLQPRSKKIVSTIFMKMIEAGARLVLGTDAGMLPTNCCLGSRRGSRRHSR